MPESSTPSSSQARQQSSITDHFSPRGQPPLVSAQLLQASQAKRPRTDTDSPRVKRESMKPVTEATMLNFGTQEAPVDLTSSPAGSPRAMSPAAPSNNNINNINNISSTMSSGSPFLKQSGPKKLQIKNLRKTTKSNADAYYVNTLASLNAALSAIYNRERIPASMEELYRGVENICRAGKSPQLLEELKARCEAYVSTQLKDKIKNDLGDDVMGVARVVEAAWTQWEQQLVHTTTSLQL